MRRRIVLFLLCVACAKRPPLETSGEVPSDVRRAVAADGVSVAPVVVLQDLPAPPIPPTPAAGQIEARLQDGEEQLPPPTVLDPDNPRDAAFMRNDYLGNIRFGGGFVRTGDVALEVRARLIELGLEDRYREEGVAWLRDMVPHALQQLHVRALAPAPAVAPPPERRRFRGLHPEDGHDNVNLPRSTFVPTPLDAAARESLAGAQWGSGGLAPQKSKWVIVPYLRAYYTHNGGWFLGQTFGCTAGARVEALVALYDATTGMPTWWITVTGRHIEPQKGQPSTSELDQYLLWSEGYAEAQLVRGWLK